jgi:heme-degrading monooxygenase HmoA
MLHLSKKQTQTFLVVARWRHKQKTYRWCKNDHVLSDKNNNAKTKHKKQKGKKKHILMYLKIVNIDIITKTKNVFKSIELLAGYCYSFCTH